MTAETPLERVLHRRQLRPSEKRGAKIGPTKRGKGTKWMVLVDGAGTPLGAIPGRGVPGGGHAPRENARESADPREARTPDRRSRLRQQRRAPLPQNGGAFSRLFPPARTTPRRPIRMAAACAAIGDDGSSSGRSAGSATSAG